MLFKFGKSGSPLCSFCNVKDETPYHLFCECSHTISLWNQLRHFLSNSLNISLLTPQSAIFGSINQKENFLVINYLLFIFKFHIYNSRSSSKLNIEYSKTVIYKTRNIELEVSKTETKSILTNGNPFFFILFFKIFYLLLFFIFFTWAYSGHLFFWKRLVIVFLNFFQVILSEKRTSICRLFKLYII